MRPELYVELSKLPRITDASSEAGTVTPSASLSQISQQRPLCPVASLRLRRRFTLHSAISAATVVAGLLGTAVEL